MADRTLIFVAELAPVVSADGSTAPHLIGSEPWCTAPADTPASTAVRGLLRNPGSLARSLFQGARVTGAITPSYGTVEVANPVAIEGGAGELDDWVDYGWSGSKITMRAGYRGNPYPGDGTIASGFAAIYVAYVQRFVASDTGYQLTLRDRLQLFDRPVITEAFAGTGGIEGNGGISKRKQFVSMDPGLIPMVLVDANKLIYYVQSTSTAGLHDQYLVDTSPVRPFDVFDSGVALTRASNYASETALLSTSPAEGEVRYWFGPASSHLSGWRTGPVYCRLGSPPAGELRVFAYGGPTDADHARAGAAYGTLTAAHMALRAGISASELAPSALSLPVVSVLVDDDTTYSQLLANQSLALQGWFGFSRLDAFRAGVLCDPESNSVYYGISAGLISVPSSPTTSVHTFSDVKGLRREPVSGMESPVWSVAVRAGKTWPCPVAGGATNTLRDYLTREPAWLATQGVSTSTLLANPGATAASVDLAGRVLQNSFESRLWLERYLVLYGGRRHFWTFATPLDDAVLAIELHDVVTLDVPRYGLSGGRKFRVVGQTIDLAAKVPVIRWVLWGGEPGQYTGGSGGPGSDTGGGGSDPPPTTMDPALRQALMADFAGLMWGTTEVLGYSVGALDAFSGAMSTDLDTSPPSTLLLHFDGTDGSTTITDSSALGHSGTGNSNCALSTTRSKFGSASLKIDRSDGGGGITIGPHSDYARTSSNEHFTLECWVYIVANENSTAAPLLLRYQDNNSNWDHVAVYGNSPTKLVYDNEVFGDAMTPATITKNAWVHLALVFDGTDAVVWVDGSEFSRVSRSISSASSTGTIYIGGNSGSPGSADTTEVYIDEVRFVLGQALYTATFTPPTGAFTR